MCSMAVETYRIDPTSERLLMSAEVTDKVAGHFGGIAVKPRTIDSWRRRGIRSSDGESVRLPTIQVGGRWASTAGAIAWFVEQINK